MAGWGQFFGGLMDKIPIMGRVERWKNEVDNLQKEKAKLLKGECDEKKANRLRVVDERIGYLNQLIKNKVSN